MRLSEVLIASQLARLPLKRHSATETTCVSVQNCKLALWQHAAAAVIQTTPSSSSFNPTLASIFQFLLLYSNPQLWRPWCWWLSCNVSCLAVCLSFSSLSVCSSRYIMQGVFIVGPLLFGLYSNGLFTSGLYPCGLSPFGLNFFGLFWTDSYSPFEVPKKETVFSHVMNLVLVIRPVCSSKQPIMHPQPAAPTLTSGEFSSRFVEQRQNAAG